MADIVICAAQSVTRAGLAAMATMATTEVTGQVDSLLALEHWLQTQSADLAVVELANVEADEAAAILAIVEALPDEEELSFLLLINDEVVVQRSLFQLIETGVVSVVPMGVSASGLSSAIDAILSGLTVLHPDFTEILFSQNENTFSPVESKLEPLTPREVQVLNQLAGGLTNRAIAQALNISEHTVKFHISAVLAKLNVTSRTEAVTVCIRAGIVML